MDNIITLLGIDLSKSSFQLHGLNHKDHCVLRKKMTRGRMLRFLANLQPCRIAIEACGGSHFFARKFLEFGHEAKIIAPQYVKPYVEANKDDSKDAEGIAEAATRPKTKYVSLKQVWQQDLQSVHRVRQRLVRNRTALMNEIRGLLYEYGIVIPKGQSALINRLRHLLYSEGEEITEITQELIQDLFSELLQLNDKIKKYEVKIKQYAIRDEVCQKLTSIPGLGPISTTILSVALGNPQAFKNGRQFAAWLGLVPKHTGTAGKNRNLGISKRGDKYIRSLMVQGAKTVVRSVVSKAAKNKKLDPLNSWVLRIYQKSGGNKAAVALANKNARIAWALVAHHKKYDECLAAKSDQKKAT